MKLRWIGLVILLLIETTARAAVHFHVSYPASKFAGPLNGRIVLYFSQRSPQPRLGPDWFNPEPEMSVRVAQILPDHPIDIDDTHGIRFPVDFSHVTGKYQVQAVVDRNLGGRAIGTSPGNLYSNPQPVDFSKDTDVDIICDQVVPEPVFKETENVKVAVMESKLLSKFYGRPTFMHAAVALPKEWDTEPDRKFPVDLDVPGFGGSYLDASGRNEPAAPLGGVPFVEVLLDPNCPTGHCVFADSANNGPWGEALITEFIPFIEKKFRCIGQPGARYVGGHSSGGWSSLWLQVTYPDFFGGVFSTAPDPVDFHAFQLVDLYKPGANVYRDAGKKIPVARLGGDQFLYTEDFAQMEAPLRGEQLGSFNAVFSPRGKDGEPLSMWDPKTGAVVPSVVEAWKKYDIALKLRKEWATLGPKLKGKLHIWVGTEDTFYLDPAVHLLAAELKELGSDAEVGFVPGNHFTMMTPDLRKHIEQEEAESFLKWQRSGAIGRIASCWLSP